jgi:two-component system chemotaxis sensor kinase CheA
MSIDMSQFYQVFFEETQEHLGGLEHLLLEIDPADPDPEDLNAVFRAAHSIKGSAGTFGFQDLAEVTHVMETLLDRVRKNEMRLTEDMVDAFLEAGDVLKNLLAAHQGHAVADQEAAAVISRRIDAMLDGRIPDHAGIAQGGENDLPGFSYEVSFIPEQQIASADVLMRNLLADIGQMGKVSVLSQGQADGVTQWRLAVEAGIDPESVRGIIEFIARSGSIIIGSFDAPVVKAFEGEDFGFFEPNPESASPPGESWGLFGEVAANNSGATDGSYGFFSDVSAVTAIETTESADGSFGLFGKVAATVDPHGPVEQAKVTAISAAAPASRMAASAAPAANAAADKGSIRVSVDKVDQMINLVGELVITQAMLTAAAEKVDPVGFERLLNGLAQLESNTRDLQESVMSIRMMPMSVVFSRFPRVVRDLSQKLRKSVELKLIGESTELDKSLIERITDPLTHLVRNSLDHGIEMPEARLAAGKQATGTITLKAYHQSGNVVIEVGDDGGGLRRDKILAKARERGLPVNDDMSDQEVWLLIFEPGFSTAEQVTEVSGRGVGMDVVKRNIAAMGGRVDIESMTGVGTRITVRLPLTLAILDGMSVGVGSDTYIIPLNVVVESLQVSAGQLRTISGTERVLQVRGEYLPVIVLHELFGCRNVRHDFERGIMVVLEADGIKAALFVDALLGQHQVVIKSLEANYRRVRGISGATIMGDGRVALILDATSLVGKESGGLAAAA